MKTECSVCGKINRVSEKDIEVPEAEIYCSDCKSALDIRQVLTESNTVRASSKKETVPSVLEMKTDGQDTRDYLAIGVFLTVLLVLLLAGSVLLRNIDFGVVARPGIQFDRWRKEFVELNRLLDQIIQYLPGHKNGKPLQKGHRLYQKKRFDQAILQYSQAVKNEPANFEAYFWRGRAYLKTKQYKRAIDDFEKTVRLNSRYTPAYNNLGWLYGRQGEYDTSIGHLNKSIELSPDKGWAYYYRGYIYRKKGDIKSALRDTRDACRLKYEKACEVYQKLKRESAIANRTS